MLKGLPPSLCCIFILILGDLTQLQLKQNCVNALYNYPQHKPLGCTLPAQCSCWHLPTDTNYLQTICRALHAQMWFLTVYFPSFPALHIGMCPDEQQTPRADPDRKDETLLCMQRKRTALGTLTCQLARQELLVTTGCLTPPFHHQGQCRIIQTRLSLEERGLHIGPCNKDMKTSLPKT